MAPIASLGRIKFLVARFRERLWVKPLAVCILSIAAAFVAKLADDTALALLAPEIEAESMETLLSIMASSMLVIATFSVASMVSAYASAGSTATPRSFTLVIADDASQNALSTFIGAFIFSIVALTVVKNDYFGKAGLAILFAMTVVVFGIVIFTFVRWVDRIARLGRIGSTISKVETATADALKRRRAAPLLQGTPVVAPIRGKPVFATRVGYVQHIDVGALQAWAEKAQVRLEISALPGAFAAPGRALAYLSAAPDQANMDCEKVAASFEIGNDRLFDDDPRFGLIVLSEIAGRALSSAVNDPGTAIGIIGVLVRLFTLWAEPKTGNALPPKYDRIQVPELSMRDMFDDAFTAIARDGAGAVEVAVRLQKALHALAVTGDAQMQEVAKSHARLALKRASIALDLEEDLATVQEAARLAEQEALESVCSVP